MHIMSSCFGPSDSGWRLLTALLTYPISTTSMQHACSPLSPLSVNLYLIQVTPSMATSWLPQHLMIRYLLLFIQFSGLLTSQFRQIFTADICQSRLLTML